ncbi:MAG: hypothetical protein ACI9RI_001480 [Oceanospirillaceae bacterium]
MQTSLYLVCVLSCGVDYQLSKYPLLPRHTTPQWAGCNYKRHSAELFAQNGSACNVSSSFERQAYSKRPTSVLFIINALNSS